MSDIFSPYKNKALVLTEENDYFNSIKKKDAIKLFLESALHANCFEDNKMIALYGSWGRGKSSIMKTLKSDFSEKDSEFIPIFFEAWKYEKGEDLALSLIDCMEYSYLELLEKNNQKAKVVRQKIFHEAKTVLKGILKGTSINLGGKLTEDLKAGIKLNWLKSIIEEYENREQSAFVKEQLFHTSFTLLEEKILSITPETKNQKILFFIDDLDRCEPDKVLDLLSVIKLFFTFSQTSLFMVGMDKKAVQQAIEIKYKETIKSSEYLEKIFDYSFSIQKQYSVEKLVQQHFSNSEHSSEITSFFDAIGFNNPRHIKKVLNKYDILKLIKNSSNKDQELQELDISTKNDNGEITSTIFTLFFLILHEMNYPLYQEVIDLEGKKHAHYQIDRVSMNKHKKYYNFRWETPIHTIFQLTNEHNIPSYKIKQTQAQNAAHNYSQLLAVFLSKNINIEVFIGDDFKLVEEPILRKFCVFIWNKQELLDSSLKIQNIISVFDKYL